MKTIIKIIDNLAFLLFGAIFAYLIFGVVVISACFKKRCHREGRVNKLSFAVFDLISNKYESMFEDALLNGYIARHCYVYLDFNNRVDRFENIRDKIFFYSIAAHPDTSVYNSGLTKVNMLLTEAKMLIRSCLIVWRNNINLIKAHDPHLLGLNGLIVAKLFRLPCVLHLNSDFDMKYRGTGKISSPILISRGLERFFESTVMCFYNLIMADRNFYSQSRHFSKKSAKRYRAFGVRVDRSHYKDPAERKDLKEKLGLTGNKIILYVGRLHPVKYPEDVLKAFGIIKKSINNAIMLMVGDGVLRDSLERMAREEGILDSIFFMGQKNYEELVDILHTADLLLAPHGGVTLVESALAATPIVAYDFDWHSEFLKDGEMGYIVPFRDFRGMAQKAIDILTDETLRSGMALRCRGVSYSDYSREASMERERKVYEELVGR